MAAGKRLGSLMLLSNKWK